MTDQELITGILQRNRDAFQFLVDRYQRKVIRTAFHFLGNMEDAKDLSQDIFLEIIRSMHAFRSRATLDTWIYRITVNRSVNVLKKNRRRDIFIRIESLFGMDHAEPVTNKDPQEQNSRDNSKLLHDAIARLPENQRIAFVLHKFDDQSYKQVAEVMNLSLSSVESLIHRAKLSLKTKLINHFPEYKKS